eukprot:scaffold1443_cov116-Isochrysis_galbana.AAC.3
MNDSYARQPRDARRLCSSEPPGGSKGGSLRSVTPSRNRLAAPAIRKEHQRPTCCDQRIRRLHQLICASRNRRHTGACPCESTKAETLVPLSPLDAHQMRHVQKNE